MKHHLKHPRVSSETVTHTQMGLSPYWFSPLLFLISAAQPLRDIFITRYNKTNSVPMQVPLLDQGDVSIAGHEMGSYFSYPRGTLGICPALSLALNHFHLGSGCCFFFFCLVFVLMGKHISLINLNGFKVKGQSINLPPPPLPPDPQGCAGHLELPLLYLLPRDARRRHALSWDSTSLPGHCQTILAAQS